MIKVNGRDKEWEKNLTVDLLLEKCKYTFPLIMVKLNGKYIPFMLIKGKDRIFLFNRYLLYSTKA